MKRLLIEVDLQQVAEEMEKYISEVGGLVNSETKNNIRQVVWDCKIGHASTVSGEFKRLLTEEEIEYLSQPLKYPDQYQD